MTLTEEINDLIKQLKPHHRTERYAPLLLKEFDKNHPEEAIDTWPGHIRYTLEEQTLDKEKMLYEQLVQIMPTNRANSDGILNIMPKFGNAFLLSGLGLDCIFMGDMLENARTLELEEIEKLQVAENLEECLYIKKAIEFIKYAKDILPDFVHIGLCFMMSPYDLAYLIRGSELMCDMYEDPEFVHRLMKKCTELYIRSVKLLKSVAGEPDESFYYFDNLYSGANLICEDCVVMISPELHKEFSIPYTQQIIQELGPCWIHFCGNGAHLLDNYMLEPGILGIQYGQLHLNEPVEDTIAKHHKYGKAFLYKSDKLEEESYEEYLRRLYAVSLNGNNVIYEYSYDKDQVDSEILMKLWHEIQDDKLDSFNTF